MFPDGGPEIQDAQNLFCSSKSEVFLLKFLFGTHEIIKIDLLCGKCKTLSHFMWIHRTHS